MKRSTMSIVLLACLVVVLLIVTAFTAVSSANAQLGNSGVPVGCWNSISSGAQGNLSCNAADGITFTDVPTGHYLLVTDVLVEPSGSLDPGGWAVGLANSGSTGPDGNYLAFRAQTLVSLGEHFTTPYLVLYQGQHLRASPTGLG